MKYLIITAVSLIVIGGITLGIKSEKTTYHAEPVEVIEEVIVEEWMTDEEAVQAAKDIIRKKELNAELDSLEEQIEALEARQTEVEKELGTY